MQSATISSPTLTRHVTERDKNQDLVCDSKIKYALSFDHASKVSTPQCLAGLASEGKLHRVTIAAGGVVVNHFICLMIIFANNFSFNNQ